MSMEIIDEMMKERGDFRTEYLFRSLRREFPDQRLGISGDGQKVRWTADDGSGNWYYVADAAQVKELIEQHK